MQLTSADLKNAASMYARFYMGTFDFSILLTSLEEIIPDDTNATNSFGTGNLDMKFLENK
jgi:hypothetical protein